MANDQDERSARMRCPSRHSLRQLVGSGIASRVAGHPWRAVGSDALSESPFIATISRLGHRARVAGHPRRAVGSDALSESPLIATIGRLGQCGPGRQSLRPSQHRWSKSERALKWQGQEIERHPT